MSTDAPAEPAAPADSERQLGRHERHQSWTIQRWERLTTPFIVVAALLPIVGELAGKTSGTVVIIIAFACWFVFVIDLVVHVRLVPGYLRSRAGIVDVVIVVLTCPWYLFVGSSYAGLVTLARLARLARVLWVALRGNGSLRLLERIGQAGIYAGGLLIGCSLIVKWAEPPSSGFATFGDAFWWGFVTLTTVGYGDLVPVTAVGRIAAVCLMLGGIALVGVLAGTLASFFGIGGRADRAAERAAAQPIAVRDSSASVVDAGVLPELEFAFEARVAVAPAEAVNSATSGDRLTFYPITGGTVDGPRLSGTVVPGGGDWAVERTDGVVELDARYLIRADDGTLIDIVNRGYYGGGPPPTTAATHTHVESLPYFRTSPVFRTDAPEHRWLSQTVFVGLADDAVDLGEIHIRFFIVH